MDEQKQQQRTIKTEDLAHQQEDLTREQADQAQGGRVAGGDGDKYLNVTMSDVLISGYTTGGDGSGVLIAGKGYTDFGDDL
jgi:hypothetical protein